MILNRIRIEGYQTLRNPVELQGLGIGLHLVHGPNETGKSTLISAISRAFFDRYNVSDQEIRALRPWGTELGPRILLEFETHGKRYRLEKKFLDEESSSLSEWSGSRFERMADSVRADDQVRELLSATASAKGAAGIDNWGVARLLWMTQQSQRLSPPKLDETLRQRLLGVMGSAVLSDAEQGMLSKLEAAYDIYYTAAKQSEKKGSPLAEARDRLLRAEKELEQWKSKWDDATRQNDSAAAAEANLAEIASIRAKADQAIRELRARAEKELELENRIKLKGQELLLASGRWRSVSAAQTELRALQASAIKKQAEVAAAEPRLAVEELALQAAETRFLTTSQAARTAAEETGALSRRMSEAALRSELVSLLQRQSELAALLASVSEIEAERLAKLKVYEARKRPKESDLLEVRALTGQSSELSKRIEDLGIEVHWAPEHDGVQVTWTVEGQDGQSAGSSAVFRSAAAGVLEIPGVGKLTIRSGAEDSRNLKSKLSEVKAALVGKLANYQCASLEELVALQAETAAIVSEGQALKAALDSALKPRALKNVSELRAEAEKARQAFAQSLSRAGLAEQELSSSSPASDLGALGVALEKAKSAQGFAEQARAQTEAELHRARAAVARTRSELEASRQTLQMLHGQLEAKAAISGSELALDGELRDALLAKNALEAEREVLTQLLPSLPERAGPRLAAAQKQLEDADQREKLARQERDRAAAVLQSAQSEGYYSKLAAAEEERALAAELLDSRLVYAQGAKLLRGLVQAKRERMNSGLMAPIESSVLRIFERIRGQPAGTLKMGSDLHELSGLDALSLGTREQAMLALRLAFGELLSERGATPEPQLIVLDDPLVNADPERQKRARELLFEASKKLQILVFTARPEDYRELKPKEHDLAALKNQVI